MEEIAIFDIDGTLADISTRQHHVQAHPKNWKAFFEGMAEDKAVASVVRLCNILHDAGVYIILCSGRNEEHRPETVEWMARMGVKYHEIRLRADGDMRSDVKAKREMLKGDRSEQGPVRRRRPKPRGGNVAVGRPDLSAMCAGRFLIGAQASRLRVRPRR